jgi:hypothetical protein
MYEVGFQVGINNDIPLLPCSTVVWCLILKQKNILCVCIYNLTVFYSLTCNGMKTREFWRCYNMIIKFSIEI